MKKRKPLRENKTKLVMVRMEPEIYRALAALSVRADLSIAAVIRGAVRDYLGSAK